MSDHDTNDTWYSPFSGAAIDLENPDPEEIDIEDIALGLSNTNRYGGQTVPSLNVAQHSINVAETLKRRGFDEETQAYGLIHDLGEAYLGDIPRPAKKRLEGFEEMEDNLLDAAYDSFNLGDPTEEQWDEVMQADNMNLIYEVEELFDDREQSEDIKDNFEGVFPMRTDLVPEYLSDLDLDTDSESTREEYVNEFHDIMERV